MARYILVPGACHGGWWYRPVVDALREAGHEADAITLSGLDPDGPPAPAANLDAHIGEVLALLDAGGGPAVLVGHSYAGSVITGVADQRPSQVAGPLYLDAFVPDAGDSCWSMNNDEQRDWYSRGSGATGLAVEPLPFFDRRARPHPLGTLMQRSKLTGAYKTISRKHYVAATGADWLPHSPFTGIADSLRQDPDWTVTALDSGHNLLANGPHDLVTIMLGLAG
jgi:pimeloyl-ACP methyl ester carboxylesterase